MLRLMTMICLRFLKYYLMLLLQMQTASSLFRLIGVVGRNMIIANTYGFLVLLLMFALSGFVLARGINCVFMLNRFSIQLENLFYMDIF